MNKLNKISLSLIAATMLAGSLNAQTVKLYSGWNNLSVQETPSVASDLDTSTIISNVGAGTILSQGMYNTEDADFQLSSITPNKGFYLYNPNADTTYSYTGNGEASEPTLTEGWNYVGFTTEADLYNLTKKLYSQGKSFEVMVNGALSKDSNSIATKLRETKKGNGYWVKAVPLTDLEKVKISKNEFKSSILLDKSNTSNTLKWVTENLNVTGDFLAPTITSSDETVIATDGTVTKHATIDKTVTITATFTSDAESDSISYDLFVPSVASTLNDPSTFANEITGYNTDGSVFANGLTVSNTSGNLGYWTTDTVDNDGFGPEANIDYEVYLDYDGDGFDHLNGDVKLSIDSSYIENGEFYVYNGASGVWFKVDEAAGLSTVANSTDNTLDISGALSNIDPSLSDLKVPDYGASFNTDNGYLMFDNTTTIPEAQGLTDISFSVNLKVDNWNETERNYFFFESTYDEIIGLNKSNNTLFLQLQSYNQEIHIPNLTSYFTEKQNLAIVKNGDFIEVFIDGVSVATDTLIGSNSINLFNEIIYIGGGHPSQSYEHLRFDGTISDLRIYNRAITSTEVNQILNKTADVNSGLIYELKLNGDKVDSLGNDLTVGGNNGTFEILQGSKTSWSDISNLNTKENIVQSDLTLPATTSDGYDIVWETNRNDIIDVSTGSVTLPTDTFEEVELRAVITDKGTEYIEYFDLIIADSNVKVYSNISDADAASLTAGETVVVNGKTVIYNSNSNYTDLLTEDTYTTDW